MKIAFFEVSAEERSFFEKNFANHTLEFFSEPLQEKHIPLIKEIDILSVFIYSKITQDVIDALPNLKLLSTRSTGTDHLKINTEYNKLIRNVPAYGENTVAEHAFALLLSITRKISEFQLRIAYGNYSLESMMCFDLKDKTLGVIGAGRIGLNTIRIAKGFGMNVIVYDQYKNEAASQSLGFDYVSWEDLLQRSDIISIHVPGLPSTKHLLNEFAFSMMKPGMMILNTARGDIIDTRALLRALNDGTVSYAGLDVVEGENQLIAKLPSSEVEYAKKIIQHPKVIFTPHSAFYGQESVKRILETTKENIQNCIDSHTHSQELLIQIPERTNIFYLQDLKQHQ